MSSETRVITIVFTSAGNRDIFSLLYSVANRSRDRWGIPL